MWLGFTSKQNRQGRSVNGVELCRVSSRLRRSVTLREVILAPWPSKRCRLPLIRGVRLREVINVEF